MTEGVRSTAKLQATDPWTGKLIRTFAWSGSEKSRTDMATATLNDGSAVQLTFPWALPQAEEESTIVADRRTHSASRQPGRSTRSSSTAVAVQVTVERHATVRPTTVRPPTAQPTAKVEPTVAMEPSASSAVSVAAVATSTPQCADSLQEALNGDRIGKPFRVGAVMFRLLKRYGISDEEIAEGIASYTAKRNAALA